MKLEIKNLSKSYKETKALQNFTAIFEPGIYALLGPNGSGKSTLMNIITDNLKADKGEITYSEKKKESENVLLMGVKFREKLGFMPQYPGMYQNFTVSSFMWYIATLKDIGNGLKGSEKKFFISEQVDEILKAVELNDVFDKKISALSGGMKQRLALAQAVLGNPEILILDEPTAGLDPKQRIAIRNYISKIAFNKIVIIATHVVSDVEYIAKNIIMLKKGVIIDNAPSQELTEKTKDKVWIVSVAESEVSSLQAAFRVTNISREEQTGKIALRIISDTKPEDSAFTTTPTLEDYYLYVFGNKISAEK